MHDLSKETVYSSSSKTSRSTRIDIDKIKKLMTLNKKLLFINYLYSKMGGIKITFENKFCTTPKSRKIFFKYFDRFSQSKKFYKICLVESSIK